MILINNISASLDTDFENLIPLAAKALKCSKTDILSASLYKKSVDARKKNDVHFCISLLCSVKNEKAALKVKNTSYYEEKEYVWQKAKNTGEIACIGFGPCGMFAALALARAGLKPTVYERGADIQTRTEDISKFFSGEKLNTNSNVQFGEGGAGTFSDGKLNTGIKDIRCRTVLKEFVRFGANKNILTDSKPHIGTDVLKTVVKNIREEIILLGGKVYFNSRFDGLKIKDGKLNSITVNGEEKQYDKIIICCGHSARDTFKLLRDNGINMEQKPFSVGVRIEHLQKDINKALYGDSCEHTALGAADYKMAVHLKNGRGVYTFCMCPGGYVINASSENEALAVNGMSKSKRNGENANSALLVGINCEDFGSSDVLAGCLLQQKIEKNAYSLGGGKVPVDTVGHLIFGKEQKIGKVKPTVKPDYTFADFYKIFPSFVVDSLKEGIMQFNNKINGFSDSEAVLTAPETRSSSPVRILRDESGNSNIVGIYPAGEGAGYAGGIMSAAVDGLKVAEKIIALFK